MTIPRGTPLLAHVDQDVDLPVAEAAAAIPVTAPGGMHAEATIQQGSPNATQTHD